MISSYIFLNQHCMAVYVLLSMVLTPSPLLPHSFSLADLYLTLLRGNPTLDRVITSRSILSHLRLHAPISFGDHSLISVRPNIYSYCAHWPFVRTKQTKGTKRNLSHENTSLLQSYLSVTSWFLLGYSNQDNLIHKDNHWKFWLTPSHWNCIL